LARESHGGEEELSGTVDELAARERLDCLWLEAEQLVELRKLRAHEIAIAGCDDRQRAQVPFAQLLERSGIGLQVDGVELDAPGPEVVLDPDAVRSAG
jgi:hypothetical protein